MLQDLLPFSIAINPGAIASVGLWALALYLGFSPVGDWLIEQLVQWFNGAERSLYTSQAEYDRTQAARNAQNTFYASLFSVVPFVAVGALVNHWVDVGLGHSWAVSVGILACMGAGVYELGRRTGQDDD